MATKRAKQELYEYWKELYKRRTGRDFIGSVYRDRAMLGTVADEIGEDELRDLMVYYFKTKNSGYLFKDFIFGYDEILSKKRAYEDDAERRRMIRQRTRERMEQHDN